MDYRRLRRSLLLLKLLVELCDIIITLAKLLFQRFHLLFKLHKVFLRLNASLLQRLRLFDLRQTIVLEFIA